MPLHERSSAWLPAWGPALAPPCGDVEKKPPLAASSLVQDAAHLADLAHLSHHLGHATRPFAQRMPPCRAEFVGYTLPFSTILHSCVSHDPHTFDPDNLAREVPAMHRNARRWTSRSLLVDSLVPRWLTVGGKGKLPTTGSLDISLSSSLCLSLSAYADCLVEMGGSSQEERISRPPIGG